MHSASLCKNQIIECLMFASLLVGFSTYKSFKDKTRILKDVFLFIDLSQVFRHQLSVWMWTGKGPLSVRVCTMVMSLFKEDMNWYFLPRYLPRPENSDKKTCRSLQLRTIWDLFFSRIIWHREVQNPEVHVSFTLTPSTNETHWFLKAMTEVSASECDCLPDCELTEFHYTHSAAEFLWGHASMTDKIILKLFDDENKLSPWIMNRELPGRVTHATSIWALFVPWNMELCQRSGCLR